MKFTKAIALCLAVPLLFAGCSPAASIKSQINKAKYAHVGVPASQQIIYLPFSAAMVEKVVMW